MKRVAIGVLLVLVFSVSAFAADDCLGVARRIWALQNQIVQKSFRGLSPGAWARYRDNLRGLKVVYLGRQVSPKTGLRLHVMEFMGSINGQAWYRIVPKDISYQNKVFRFWTLEPMEGYARVKNYVFYLSKGFIETFMRTRGREWSTFLKEGVILSPPDCNHVPVVKEIFYRLPGGKRVRATVIRSRETGGEVYCSPEVPFGLIKAVSSDGRVSKPELLDFGFKGGKGWIPKDAITRAMPMPVLPGGGGKLPFHFPLENKGK